VNEWFGAVCDQKLVPVNITVNESAPVVTVGSETYKYKIDVTVVQEVSPAGSAVDFDLTKLNVSAVSKTVDGTTTYNYSITFPSGAYIVSSFMTVDKASTITFAGQKVDLVPGLVKVTVTVFKWPFTSPKNSLRIALAIILPQDANAAVTVTKSDGVAQYVKTGQVFGKFLSYALIDGIAKVITTTYDTATENFLVTVPRFTSYATIDPDFGVTDPNPNPTPTPTPVPEAKTGGKKDDNHRKIVLGTTIGILVGGTMIAVIAYATVVIVRKGRRNVNSNQA
jgi:hypothetical protein